MVIRTIHPANLQVFFSKIIVCPICNLVASIDLEPCFWTCAVKKLFKINHENTGILHESVYTFPGILVALRFQVSGHM
ncbi:MAG: hypothetical protein BA872_03950 [Desulfobacterales bacterium C00003060]|nr:MAG: hypothetical protein BA872_03950 [Desulfobacterales bacterium C00003060]